MYLARLSDQYHYVPFCLDMISYSWKFCNIKIVPNIFFFIRIVYSIIRFYIFFPKSIPNFSLTNFMRFSFNYPYLFSLYLSICNFLFSCFQLFLVMLLVQLVLLRYIFVYLNLYKIAVGLHGVHLSPIFITVIKNDYI